ncbi:MAG: UDP-N-acetylglucosamine--N-acetylmuramyl-(pentapeptide) pyrophosphoryl-undecaprenol [Planctomycetaceae bacterium]|nr:UDP-N-acetylglucosamine--N-acetylmuramyl-(pentapeptide) pyrophosphoryl-undecaprenol [Planctomycetaceae bacterium]
MTSPLYYFAGGGTGGHLFPGLAVAAEIVKRAPQSRVVFIGSERSIEHDLVGRHGFEHLGLTSEPLTRLRQNPVAFFRRNWRAYRTAVGLIKRERPTAVIGLGGFASAPIVLAAHRQRVPTLLLEQNSIPGRSTRWLSHWANVVCLSYVESAAYFSRRVKTRLTGNPVRVEISKLPQRINRSFESTAPSSLLILGGSQGAQPLNEAIVWLLQAQPQLFVGWRIVHQTGIAQLSLVQERYRQLRIEAEVSAFLPDMAERYRAATLVISRAGATTLAELACAGLPAVLVPYPLAADNHQWHNARGFESAGAAAISLQGNSPEATGQVLLAQIQRIMEAPQVLTGMSQAMIGMAQPHATESVLNVLSEVAPRP